MSTRRLAQMLPVALLGLALVTFTVWGVAGCQTGGGPDGNANVNTSENENENIADNENENANTAGNENTNTAAPDGGILFAADCQACHSANTVGGATAAEITGAIANISTMQNAGPPLTQDPLVSLTAEEIAAIADFLAQ